MPHHEFYMQRCLQLAAIGKQWVAPNPMVGAVVVNNGKIIGEGYHKAYGEPHAEVNAIKEVKDKKNLIGATIYVSLEPCAHYGKTPPCTNLIIESGITKVVVACLDPNPLVAGKGIEQLKNAGIEVITGVLNEQAIELNKEFIHFHTHKKPYVILKWAQTADGYCGRQTDSNLSNKITNWFADLHVHQIRSQTSAVLIGYNTAILDNPLLSNRYWFGKNPTRIVIDTQGQLPDTLKLFNDNINTLVYTLYPKANTTFVSFIQLKSSENMVPEIMEDLYQRNIQSILIEGGPKTLQKFIDYSIWNECHIFTSSNNWGAGIAAPLLVDAQEVANMQLLTDNYKIFKPITSL
jgi:diaminohydroxyphosphoribosylaminopyrimidine deaminase/5-amino-6-(5-phosphoribosylamino)uracil reductase